MKTLQNHIILYDAECPMCKAYTKAFTQTGMLDTAGRASYQDMPEVACPVVDRRRAVNEIALVNTQTGEVLYGVDSLFKVLGNAWPVFKPLFGFGPFVWFMRKVYAFISYNRRVIIPATHTEAGRIQPTFRLIYRLAYLIFSWLVVALILTQYAIRLAPLVPVGGAYREYLICGGQIFFQGVIISLFKPAKLWEYLGNMMTISLAGSLLLLPVLGLALLMPLSALMYTLCFMGVAGLMFLEHIRRTKLLGLGWLLTVMWMVYRLLVLILIYLTN
ncbi:DCC1-like thiol-disulfide oxidoreductase family protein [Mucilaginibacter terrae]|uniref:DCC family thiol-disulfide oxidoreductase YuxK n=1 Tax=Mucilaginibacter terrae TaxID=1955052 RepID=A0ABU3GSN7_9SPHI|nr:DCC1-like thiol-disulfide oxidoreductase family protein [Mucilaginibacter terrae]MDT3402596.1 putative DCC family thiol-disulfide oxidoreductase YuxK [Mucilaginibacter terrae]